MLQLPLNVDPGPYELVLTVRDDIQGIHAELVEPFTVEGPEIATGS
jgi:hypothetical protein